MRLAVGCKVVDFKFVDARHSYIYQSAGWRLKVHECGEEMRQGSADERQGLSGFKS